MTWNERKFVNAVLAQNVNDVMLDTVARPCYEVTFVKHQFSYNSQSPAALGGTRKEPDTNYGLNHPAILGLGTNRLTVLAVGSMIYGRESTD